MSDLEEKITNIPLWFRVLSSLIISPFFYYAVLKYAVRWDVNFWVVVMANTLFTFVVLLFYERGIIPK
jgi:hypothetical protein